MISLKISANDSQQTLLQFCKKYFPTATLADIYHLFYQKKIKINGKRTTNQKYQLQVDDVLQIYDKLIEQHIKPAITTTATIQTTNFEIAHQDEQILVAVKEHGVLTHSINNNSLDYAVRNYLNSQVSQKQPSVTFTVSHQARLDKMTKGLIIYPKTKAAQNALTVAQKHQQIVKRYYAIVHGKFTKSEIISGFISHDESHQRMIFSKKLLHPYSKACQTQVWPIITDHNFSLIECELITGRKHQIRATLSAFGFPILGDFKYGANDQIKDKIYLFAYYLGFKNLTAPLSYLNHQILMLKDLRQKLEKVLETEIRKKMIK